MSEGGQQDQVPGRSEPELIRAAQEGDRGAYDSLVRLYQKQVYRWAFHVVRNHDLADEVAQEVFVRTYEALDRVDPDRPLGAWFCRSTTNVSLNLLRKSQFRTKWIEEQRRDPPDHRHDSSQPDAALHRREVLARIQQAINTLTPMYRAVILLRVKENMSYGEIAEALGISMGTVMSRLARARRKLRISLGDLLDELRE
jgi:RNA polymerase sigma-70 factor (ECF subfamily)